MGQLSLHAGQLGSFLCCWGVLFTLQFYSGFFCASEYLSAELAFLKPAKSCCSRVSEGLARPGELLTGLPPPQNSAGLCFVTGKGPASLWDDVSGISYLGSSSGKQLSEVDRDRIK